MAIYVEPLCSVGRFASPVEAARAWVLQLRGRPATTIPGLKRTLLEELYARQETLDSRLRSNDPGTEERLRAAESEHSVPWLRVTRECYVDGGWGVVEERCNGGMLFHYAVLQDIYSPHPRPLLSPVVVMDALDRIATQRRGGKMAWTVRGLDFETIGRLFVHANPMPTKPRVAVGLNTAGTDFAWPVSMRAIPAGCRNGRVIPAPLAREVCAAHDTLPGGVAELYARVLAQYYDRPVIPFDTVAFEAASAKYDEILRRIVRESQ